SDVTTACFGTGLMSQPNEGNERVNPTRTLEFQIKQDSAGPGKWRGGCGVQKTSVLLESENAVMSYICDRERAVVWGVDGGLPSMPHGLTIKRSGSDTPEWLGSVFSDFPMSSGDEFARPTAGGGGFGDPLERDPEAVKEDVIDEYVSMERAAKDYGVVIKELDPEICSYEVDMPATEKLRADIREQRRDWAQTDPEVVAEKFRSGEIDALDAVRRYAVILDWETGDCLPNTTQQFRESFNRRSTSHWS
ncbi:MAG: hydantoinase B/oxoprolinase family protein, partial [Mangrovicoccus sp.]